MAEKKPEKAHKLREEIIEIGSAANAIPYEWGKRYKEIRDKKLWKYYDSKSFTSFCADPDLPLAITTVWSYIKLYEITEELKISPTIFEQLPTYKFVMIMPHLNKDNKDELIHQALTLSKSDLRYELDARGGGRKAKKSKPIPKVFRCSRCGGFKWDAVPEEICSCH